MENVNFSLISNSSGSGFANLSNFTYNFINSSGMGIEEGQEKGEETSLGLTIILYINVILLAIIICSCFLLIFYACIIEFCERCPNIPLFTRRQNWVINNNEDLVNDQNSINHNKYEESQDKIIKETPIDDIVLLDNIDTPETSRLICPICLEDIKLVAKSREKVVQLNCSHIYHQKCISKWCFSHHNKVANCPVCRNTMEHIGITIE